MWFDMRTDRNTQRQTFQTRWLHYLSGRDKRNKCRIFKKEFIMNRSPVSQPHAASTVNAFIAGALSRAPVRLRNTIIQYNTKFVKRHVAVASNDLYCVEWGVKLYSNQIQRSGASRWRQATANGLPEKTLARNHIIHRFPFCRIPCEICQWQGARSAAKLFRPWRFMDE